ncbi:MAG: FAD binding domain-containing protein [Pseudomonadota bacterium]
MRKFDYFRPTTLDEALKMLDEYGARATASAGGTDLVVKAKKGKLDQDILVSLRGIKGLSFISAEPGAIRVGGGTTLRDLELSAEIGKSLPALMDAVRNMASVQIRNQATMAGNIVNAAPSADTAPPLLASGAELVLAAPAGTRRVPLDGFFLGPGRTGIRPGEILTEFIIPLSSGPHGQAYWKHARRKAMDLAMVSVAVHLELEPDLTTCRLARVALGVAAPTPIRTPEAEKRLVGRAVTAELLDSIGDASCEESLCRDSIRGEAWYRQEIIKVMVRRMGLLALARARQEFGEGLR